MELYPIEIVNLMAILDHVECSDVLRREEVNQTKHRLRIAAQSAGINHDGDYVPLSINGTVTIEN